MILTSSPNFEISVRSIRPGESWPIGRNSEVVVRARERKCVASAAMESIQADHHTERRLNAVTHPAV